jgi:uncharacterized protein (TIGR02996 family)
MTCMIAAVGEGAIARADLTSWRVLAGGLWRTDRLNAAPGADAAPIEQLYLVCPNVEEGELWLVALLHDAKPDERGWAAAAANRLRICSLGSVRRDLQLPGLAGEARKGLPALEQVEQALARPVALSERDVALLGSLEEVRRATGRTQPNHIELARSRRSSCRSCGETIPKLSLRFAEQGFNAYANEAGYTFHHLACAAASRPEIFAAALAEHPGELPDQAQLEATVERSLSRQAALRRAEAAPMRRGGDPWQIPVANKPESRDGKRVDAARYESFVAEIAAEPEETERRLVFADWLQSVGDPRGELVAVQQEKHQADKSRFDELLEQEQQLLARHPDLGPTMPDGWSARWRAGFVDRLELTLRRETDLDRLAELLAHPSLVLVSELSLTSTESDLRPLVAALQAAPPAALRDLVLLSESYGPAHVGPLAPLVEQLLRLERLTLRGVPSDLSALRSSSLRRLQIDGLVATAQVRLSELSPSQLPALATLELELDSGASISGLLKALPKPLLSRLESITLRRAELGKSGHQALKRALSGRAEPLSCLDLGQCTSSSLAALRRALEPLTRELVAPQVTQRWDEEPAEPEQWYVRHIKRPQWGRGKVLSQRDGKLEIEFEQVGKKVIRADLGLLETL